MTVDDKDDKTDKICKLCKTCQYFWDGTGTTLVSECRYTRWVTHKRFTLPEGTNEKSCPVYVRTPQAPPERKYFYDGFKYGPNPNKPTGHQDLLFKSDDGAVLGSRASSPAPNPSSRRLYKPVKITTTANNEGW